MSYLLIFLSNKKARVSLDDNFSLTFVCGPVHYACELRFQTQ